MRRIIGSVKNNKLILSEEKLHHLKVLRFNVGEKLEVITEDGVYLAELLSYNPWNFKICKKVDYTRELSLKITVFFPLIKAANLEWGIEKCIELGADEIHFFACKRTSEKMNKEVYERRKERWQKIIDGAVEQSNRDHRVILGNLYDIEDIYKLDFDYKFVPYEKESLKGTILNDLTFEKEKSLSLIVGPEGGFEEDEINKLIENGYTSFSLGKRILRAETAVLAGFAILGNMMEN